MDSVLNSECPLCACGAPPTLCNVFKIEVHVHVCIIIVCHFHRNVWIFPYYNILFPEEYKNMWCRFKSEEVYKLKQALSGTLLLGISEGMGSEYENYIQLFDSEAVRITGDDIYDHHRHFIQTTYIHDSLRVVAAALDELIKEKADKQNLTEEYIEITMEDRQLLADTLRGLTFLGGVTGNISFTEHGKRRLSPVELRNFVPIENTNFSISSSLFEDPWIIQTRGYLKVFYDGHFTISYFDEHNNISKIPTIVFHDGTTNIPSDRPYRVFVRSKPLYCRSYAHSTNICSLPPTLCRQYESSSDNNNQFVSFFCKRSNICHHGLLRRQKSTTVQQ